MAPAMALRVVSAPAENSEREEGRQLVVAQARRVLVGQLGVDDGGEHVRARVGALLLDESPRRIVHAVDRGLPLRGHGEEVRLVGDVEDVLDRFEEEVPVGLGDAEQQADRLHRQLGGHVDQEVALRRRPNRGGRRIRRRSSPSRFRTAAGVRPLVTSRRIRAWRGSSIMFSTTPATGRSWMIVPP